MKSAPRYRRLTPLRCIEVLAEVEDGPVEQNWRVNRLREAIREHLRAEVTKRPRRRKAA